MDIHPHTLLMKLGPLCGLNQPSVAAGYVTIFSFSFLSSWHCALMCGPLVSAYSCSLNHKMQKRWDYILFYNMGRMISYCSVGAILGSFANLIPPIVNGKNKFFAITIGVLTIVWAFTLILQQTYFTSSKTFFLLFADIEKKLSGALNNWRTLPPHLSIFSLGLVTVLLPCATLTPVFLLAISSGSAWRGAAYMASFYFGTLTVMMIAPMTLTGSMKLWPMKQARIAGALFLLIAGILTIFRS